MIWLVATIAFVCGVCTGIAGVILYAVTVIADVAPAFPDADD